MAIESCICTPREVFIDLSGPTHFDDYEDPVYPYTPPSVDETIKQLANCPPRSFDALVLSVPTMMRTSPEMSKTLRCLTSFLASPACSGLQKLRICGTLSLLNLKALHDALKKLPILELILQEPRVLYDSYAIAGLLSALVGIKTLHLSLNVQDAINLHPSFQEETKATFSRLERLQLSCNGDTGEAVSKLFNTGSIPGLKALDICYQGSNSPRTILPAVLSAASSPDDTADWMVEDRLMVSLR